MSDCRPLGSRTCTRVNHKHKQTTYDHHTGCSVANVDGSVLRTVFQNTETLFQGTPF